MNDQSAALRASDTDRERVIEQLRRHAAEGRLDTEELEARVHAALAARTLGELEPLLLDLPAGAPVERPVTRRHGPHQEKLRSLLPLAFLLIAIWALTGMGYFWPVWPLLGVGFVAFGGGRHMGCGKRRRRPRAVRGPA